MNKPAFKTAGKIARESWRLLKTGALLAADAIIEISLLRKGSRPKPGTRISWPRGLRENLSREQNGLCVYCRAKIDRGNSHIDHAVPVNQGGTNDRDNLQLLCAGCNLRKSDRSDREFRQRYRELLPQEQSRMPDRSIPQSRFRAVAKRSQDTDSYRNFKAGKYLTPAQKITSGSVVTGIATAIAIYLPIDQLTTPEDASILLMTSLGIGSLAGIGVRLRARYTGKDQED